MRNQPLVTGGLVSGLALWASLAAAQSGPPDAYTLRRAIGTDSYTLEGNSRQAPRPRQLESRVVAPRPAAAPPLDAAARSVIGYYGSRRAQATLDQLPSRPRTMSPAAPAVHPGGKPFSTVSRPPTVSPYLNLFLDEGEDAPPNYHVFVRPQQEHNEQIERQQSQLQRLRRPMQQAGPRSPAVASSTAARFGDTGRYYSAWR